jgi:hypothetical protein
MIIFKDKQSTKLKALFAVGIDNKAVMLSHWSNDSEFWENEQSNVGTLNPEDLGITNIPKEPGIYMWEGTFATWGPDYNGDYDAEYRGKWTLAPDLAIKFLHNEEIW